MEILKGDIILFPVRKSSSLLDRLIGAAQFLMGFDMNSEQYDHVAIADGTGKAYQAKWPKTGLYPLKGDFEVWRIKNALPYQIDCMLEWCKSNEGEWYDIIALLTAGWIKIRHSYVCSEYAADAMMAGTIIKQELKFITPDQIKYLVSMVKIN